MWLSLMGKVQVGHNVWLDELLIQQTRSGEFRVVQPQEESDLDHVVEWNPIDHEADDALCNRAQREHHPVRQPLRVIRRVWRVNSLEAHVCGVGEGEEI